MRVRNVSPLTPGVRNVNASGDLARKAPMVSGRSVIWRVVKPCSTVSESFWMMGAADVTSTLCTC